MPLPDLSLYCKPTALTQGGCITFPGGIKLCASGGIRFGDAAALTESFFGMINTALTPLAPFFNIIDVFIAVVKCFKAIPACLAPPSPKPILDALIGLEKALSKLLSMVPILSVPIMVKGILQAIILGLTSIKIEIQALVAQQTKIIAAALLAAEPGNFALQASLDCATQSFDAQINNLNESMGGLNRLIGLVNVLLGIAGMPEVPSIDNLGDDASASVGRIDAAIHLMQIAVNAIPG